MNYKNQITGKHSRFFMLSALLFFVFAAPGYCQDKNHPYRFIKVGATPFHLAAANGDIDKVKSFLSQGADVDSKAKITEATPLDFAAWKGQIEVATLLINQGAHVNARTDWGATPLHYAAGLNASGCLVRSGQDSPGLTEGHLAVARLLIKHGADVNIKSRSGQTALMSAASCNAADIALLLIENGADMNAREHQYTALEMAVHRGPAVAALLIKHGANVNTSDPYTGTTPLHTAVTTQRLDLIELLLKHGANPNAINNQGWTPQDVSTETSIDEIFKRYK